MTPGGEGEAWLAIDERSKADDISDELVGLVKPELQPGERLLWAARAHFPQRSFRVGPHAKCGSLTISLLFASAAGLGTLRMVDFILSQRSMTDWDHVGFAWFLLFILGTGLAGSTLAFGTLLMWASKVADLRRLRRRIYALTDRRAIIWCPEAGSAPVSLHCGTIEGKYFKFVRYPHGYESVLLRRLDRDPCGFLGVADALHVKGLVRQYLLAGRVKVHS